MTTAALFCYEVVVGSGSSLHSVGSLEQKMPGVVLYAGIGNN